MGVRVRVALKDRDGRHHQVRCAATGVAQGGEERDGLDLGEGQGKGKARDRDRIGARVRVGGGRGLGLGLWMWLRLG